MMLLFFIGLLYCMWGSMLVEMVGPEGEPVTTAHMKIEEGPSAGLMVGDFPGLLLTERRLVSQIVYVPLDPQPIFDKIVAKRHMSSKWYDMHIARAKDSVRGIMSHVSKTFIKQGQLAKGRPKRAAGWAIATVVMTVVGLVMGTAMNVANSVSMQTLEVQSNRLKQDITQVKEYLQSQNDDLVEVIKVVNQTIIAQANQAKMIDRMTNLHEHQRLANVMYWEFIDPLMYTTQDYLREVQDSISALIRGQIPLFLISTDLVKNILSNAHPAALDELQISVAMEMGTAVPLYYDIEKMHLSFLINLPLIIPSKVYQLKRIFNVGTWKDQNYLKVKAPDLVAYQARAPEVYFIPKLDACISFKDVHYLCPGNPFIPDVSGVLCGIQHGMEAQLCDVAISRPPSHEFSAASVLVQNRWLVSTKLKNLTLTYTEHGTYGLHPLTHRVSLITVPKNAIITVGDQVLFHTSGESIEQEVQMVNTFRHQDIDIDDDLEYLLHHKNNHSIQFTIHKHNSSTSTLRYDYEDMGGEIWRNPTEIRLHVVIGFSIVSFLWLLALTYRVCHPYRACIRIYPAPKHNKTIAITQSMGERE